MHLKIVGPLRWSIIVNIMKVVRSIRSLELFRDPVDRWPYRCANTPVCKPSQAALGRDGAYIRPRRAAHHMGIQTSTGLRHRRKALCDAATLVIAFLATLAIRLAIAPATRVLQPMDARSQDLAKNGRSSKPEGRLPGGLVVGGATRRVDLM